MSPSQLEQAVAEATGESRREIRRRGFQLCRPQDALDVDEDEVAYSVVDWDALEAERPVAFP